MVQLSYSYMTTGKTIALTIQAFVSKVMSLLFLTLSIGALDSLRATGRVKITLESKRSGWKFQFHHSPVCAWIRLHFLISEVMIVGPSSQECVGGKMQQMPHTEIDSESSSLGSITAGISFAQPVRVQVSSYPESQNKSCQKLFPKFHKQPNIFTAVIGGFAMNRWEQYSPEIPRAISNSRLMSTGVPRK